MYVIELFGMPCIEYLYITQRKDPEEELLRALLGGLAVAMARLAYPIFDLFDFFFKPGQCFSLTTIQPEQYFSASFSQISDQRTGAIVVIVAHSLY